MILSLIGFTVMLALALFLTLGFLAAFWWSGSGGSSGDLLFMLVTLVIAWVAVYLLCPFEVALKGGA